MASLEDDGASNWPNLVNDEKRTGLIFHPIATPRNANHWRTSGVAIKSELEHAMQSPSQSPSASLKRRRSEEPEDMGEKRQRVESISAADDDMGALFAQAAAAAARHIEESSSDTVQNDPGVDQSGHDTPAGQSGDTTSKSNILARALSLPMLESLVSCTIPPKR